LNWKAIHTLFEGFLGKGLLIIALATPMSFLAKVNVGIHFFVISLIGAIIIFVGYIWAATSTPAIIKNHKDGHYYAKDLIKLRPYIDIVSEFKVLEDYQVTEEYYDGYFYKQKKFESIGNAENDIGKKESIRSMAILKFNLINNLNPYQRWFLSFIFLLGCLFIYFPLAYRVLITLGVSL
jgi:hypothetical protein